MPLEKQELVIQVNLSKLKNVPASLSVGLLCFMLALATTSQSAEVTGQGQGAGGGENSGKGGGCNGKKSHFSKNDIQAMAITAHGSKSSCYMKLYEAETSVNPACHQTHTPNPPGMGLCTLEGNANLRNNRGGPCAKPDSDFNPDDRKGVINQMKCCAHIMQTRGNDYFQPVKEKKVSNCEGGPGEAAPFSG